MYTKPVTSLSVRASRPEDENQIRFILFEQDLGYQDLAFSSFWVAEGDGEIISILRLEEFADFYFCSAVGTRSVHQHRGHSSRLILSVLGKCRKPVYLYTIIPDFFSRFGFTLSETPSKLPPRSRFDCPRCEPDRCACMVRIPQPNPYQ